MKQVWVDKYIPQSLSDYVFKDKRQKKLIESWLASGSLVNSLFTGSPGVGKSSLARLLLKELNINKFDILEINASKDNGVDFIRDTVTRFCETNGYGDMRYVFLDEADGLSFAAQGTLRNAMERYSRSVRFLLTANYENKISNALKSRCEAGRMHIDKVDKDEFTLRLINVLQKENVEVNIDAIDQIVQMTYPDMRRALNKMQSCVFNNNLELPEEDASSQSDYIIDMVALFKAGDYRGARELICSQAQPDEYEDIFRFMYQNLELWADTEDKENKCILVIRDGAVKHTSIGDPEINLSATFCELEMISKGQI